MASFSALVTVLLVTPIVAASPPAEPSESLADVVAEARAVAWAPRHDTEVSPEALTTPGGDLRIGTGPMAIEVGLPETPAEPRTDVPTSGDRLLLAGTGRSVSVNLVIGEAGSSEFAFDFELPPGVQLLPEADGSITIGEPLSAGIIAVYGEIDPAWAVDANGEPVPTAYVVEGATLTQVVDVTDAALPVVADPSISLGWYIYVRYSKAEIQRYWSGTDVANKVAFGLACQAIPPPYNVACTIASVAYMDSIGQTFKDAKRYKQCVEIRLMYVTYAPVGWKRYSC